MDYFLDLSRAFDLFTAQQSFDEQKPFIRLNLSGKSYGLAYVNEELACVFAEHPAEDITSSILFEIAEIFPHCLVEFIVLTGSRHELPKTGSLYSRLSDNGHSIFRNGSWATLKSP